MQTLSIVSLAFAMVALPARAIVVLRRRRASLAPWRRLVPAALSAAITLAALLALDGAADTMLAAHMLQHLLIGDVVPLLLVLSVRGPLVVHLVPGRAVRAARRLGAHRLLAVATRPAVAFLVWTASLAIWHIPAVYDRALASAPLHALEHTTFIVAGLLVWTVLLDPARRAPLPGWRRFGYALAVLAASGILANVLIDSYQPLYPSYAGANNRAFGLSAVDDQDLAALGMMLEQLATVGAVAVLSARRQLLAANVDPPQRHPLAV